MSEFDDLLARVRSGEAAPAPVDDYKSLLARVRGAPDPSLVESSNIVASFKKPDQAAEQMRLVRDLKEKLGEDWSPEAIDPMEAQRRLRVAENDHVLRNSPKLAERFLDTGFASLAHDDAPLLGEIEKVASYIGNRGRAVAAAIPQVNAGLWGLAAAPFEMVGADNVGDWLRKQQKITQAMGKAWGPQDNPGWLTNSIDQGLTSAGQNLLTMPLAFLPGGQSAALTGMVAPVFGEAYGKNREAGNTPLQALNAGAADAAFEWAGEKFGLGNLVKNIKVGSGFGKTLLGYMAREVPGEMGTTIAQSFNEYANINPDKPLKEWVAQLPDELAQTFIATMVGGGAVATTVKAADKAISFVSGQDQQAQQATQLAEALSQFNTFAEASRVRQRDTDTAQSFFQSLMDDGNDSVWITPDALAQSGMAEQIAQALPSVAEQIQSAITANHDIELPIAELMAKLPGEQLAQSIIPHVAETPGGFTMTTAQEYMQSDKAKLLQDTVEEVLAGKQLSDEHKQSQEAVKQAVLDNLNQHSKFGPTVNEAYAALVSAYAATRAWQKGVTPEQFFADHLLRVQSEAMGGQSYSQGNDIEPDDFIEGGIEPVNGVEDEGKFNALINRMEETGAWIGRPVLGYKDASGGKFALTGSHRIAAAKRAGVDIPVVWVDDSTLEFQNESGEFLADVAGTGDDRVADFLREAGDIRAADLMDAELSANAKGFQLNQSPRSTGNSGGILNQKNAPGEGKNATTGDLDRVNEHVREAVESRISKLPAEDQERLRRNLEEHKGTAWAAAAVKGMAYREMLERAMAGEDISNLERNEIWGKQDMSATEIIKTFKKYPDVGSKLLVAYLNTYDFIGGNRKAENDISTSFSNCEPSKACAIHCYAAGSNARPNEIAKSEFTEFMIEHFPEEMASQIHNRYNATNAGQAGLSLRLNDKGDLSPAQVKLIGLLNDKGVAVQVFSKRPELLRQLSDINLKMLSIDGTNMQVAFDNPDLRLAVTITDEMTEEMLTPIHNRVSVYLPVNLKGKAITAEELRERFPNLYGRMRKENLCPVDGGKLATKAGTSFVNIQNGTAEKGLWTCTACDLYGNAGCFKGDRATNQRRAKEQTVALSDMKRELQVKKALKDLEKQLELLQQLGGISDEQRQLISQTLSSGQRDLRIDVAAEEAPGSAAPASTGTGKTSQGAAGIRGPDGNSFNQGVGNRGAYNPATNIITLLKDADLSTFLHEGGHYFFETDIALANQIAQDARVHGYDLLSDGDKQILADVSALLTWHGIEGSIEQQLMRWSNMDFEEKRSHHERTAESFERYLFEGKAPSIELQGYFQKFGVWLKRVYSALKDFLAGHPEAGKLNDEVRAVFDRMLATNDQIELAEKARSLMPLFTSAQQAGMTEEAFAAYQQQDTQAALDAVDDLQARTLRDLKWARNAQSRELKRLQKESAEVRATVEMEARRQIMSKPVYQAWAFLTGKLTADNKIENPKPPKSDQKFVDETMDSLFVAIAKLGGISKEELVGTWGIDPADKPKSGVFGKHVWRADNGLSIDGMREALAQYGYVFDDLHQFEEAFKAELSGDTQYSRAYDPGQFRQPEDGAQVVNPEGVTAGRLSLPVIGTLGLPVEIVNHLKALKMTAKEGWHPDLIAERFGFRSGEDMIRQITAAETPKEAIEALTDKMMLENHAELSTPEALERAADIAVFNEARARFVATELAAVERLAGGNKTLTKAAQQYADAMIGRLLIKNIKPQNYAAAEARAAKAADKAHKAGDVQQAAVEKRNQMINIYAAKAAYAAQEEADQFRRTMAQWATRSDDKLKKSYDIDLANVVRAILGEYGIAEKRGKRASEYLEVFKQNDPDMYGVVESSVQYAERNAKPFKELTVDEMRALKDEIGAVMHLARRVRQSEVDGNLIDREEIIAHLDARLDEIGVPDTPLGAASAVTEDELRLVKLRTALANMTRAESWVDKMDGSNPMGPFRTYLFNRVKDAADAYRADKAKYLREYRALLYTIAPTLKPMLIDAPELGYTFGKDTGGSAMNEILHALLHTGNQSNKRKMLLGRRWAAEITEGVIDTGRWDAFVARLVKEGKLTQAHFAFVQGVWDLLESTKPLAQKTHRDVFGKYFDEVTADGFVDPFGVQRRGGYVPAMADSRVVTDAKLRALSEDENASMAFAFPTTNKGFTKSRVEYNRPLLLDLKSLAQHLDKVLLFAHMEMPVRDVQRLVKQIGGKLDRLDPGIIAGMITPWLNRAAKQQVVTPITADAGMSRFLNKLRSRAGMAAMFGNLANAIQQITGFSMAAVKVKPGLLMSATADWVKHPRKMAAAAAESSPYMRERLTNEVASMADEIDQILLNPTLLQKGQQWSMRHAYFLQSAVDSVIGPIIWTAAYNQAIEQKQEHKDAVRLADAAVRQTQGSTLPEDIARAEGGNAFVRLFTQFAGYFNMQANLLGTEFAKVMQEQGLRKGAGRGMYILMLGFLAPAIVGELVMQLFRGGPDDEDKDGEYLDDWLAQLFVWAPLRNATAMIPVAGQAINSAVNAWNSKPYDDRMASSPAISMIESAAKAAPDLYQNIVEDKGNWQKTVRDVATLISLSVGLPANIAARPIGYEAGVAQGKIMPTSTADRIRGDITGTASPASKN